MEIECQELCRVLNLFPGICTVESCWGHGRQPYRIWFTVTDLKYLSDVVYWFCRYFRLTEWRVEVETDASRCPAYFLIQGPTGDLAYKQSLKVAKQMKKYLNGEPK